MEKKIKHLIEKLIIKKYPVVTDVAYVRDIYSGVVGFERNEGRSFTVGLYVDECIDSELMNKINNEIKTLFEMISSHLEHGRMLTNVNPDIKTFFDCDDGEGFVFYQSSNTNLRHRPPSFNIF
jgi:hypothetical protein